MRFKSKKYCCEKDLDKHFNACKVMFTTPSVYGAATSPSMKGIKVGDIVFIKKGVFQPADDHGPGGMLAKRGDAVVVTAIRVNPNDYVTAQIDKEAKSCELKYTITVRHPWVKDGSGFIVYRNEIMPTDPLVTIVEQREWCGSKGKEALEARFRTTN